MSWRPVRRSMDRSVHGVLLSLARQRLRNDRTLCLIRVSFGEDVLSQAGFSLGTWIEVLRGEEDDLGKIALRKSEDPHVGFRISGHRNRQNPHGQISFDAALLGLDDPPNCPTTQVEFHIEPGLIEFLLPSSLHGDPSTRERGPPGGQTASPHNTALRRPSL